MLYDIEGAISNRSEENDPLAGKGYLGVEFGAHTTANDSGNIR